MAMLNIASLPKHLYEIRLLLHDKKLDVLALNETRLDSSISDGLMSIGGFDILRSDRKRNGGGVCTYVRCHVNYENRPDLIPNDLEAVCLEIKQANSKSFFRVFIDLQIQLLRLFQKLKG
jgi:exonuclease III